MSTFFNRGSSQPLRPAPPPTYTPDIKVALPVPENTLPPIPISFRILRTAEIRFKEAGFVELAALYGGIPVPVAPWHFRQLLDAEVEFSDKPFEDADLKAEFAEFVQLVNATVQKHPYPYVEEEVVTVSKFGKGKSTTTNNTSAAPRGPSKELIALRVRVTSLNNELAAAKKEVEELRLLQSSQSALYASQVAGMMKTATAQQARITAI